MVVWLEHASCVPSHSQLWRGVFPGVVVSWNKITHVLVTSFSTYLISFTKTHFTRFHANDCFLYCFKLQNLSIDHTKHSKSSSSNSHHHLRKHKVNNYESICASNNSINNTSNNSILNSDYHTVSGHSIGQRSIRQQREVAYKIEHPNRLHPDIWHNEANEFNDGPACSCKPKYRIGPLHNQYEGEQVMLI